MNTPRARILAIDDMPANLMTLGSVLESEGEFALQFATSGADGMAMALKHMPDLILLDVMMPEMDGFEVFRCLKASPVLQHIPVVFMTALNDLASENAGLKMGAADYITKPIDVASARQRIVNLLEREQLSKTLELQRDHLEDQLLSGSMALSIAKEAAHTAQQAKAVFLRNMTHELRTPMNAIIGLTELALGRATDVKQAEQLRKVQLASEQLLGLITQMMDYTGLQARQLHLDEEPINISVVLDSLTALVGSDAKEKGLALTAEAQPALADMVLCADPLRLGQVLLAMTGNAIKFTQQGSVAVSVSLAEQTATDVLLRFEVRDTGIGIAPANQRRVFELFEQTDESTQRRYGGTGLGLALSRELIEQMGGQCGVQSELGVGSVFWFTVRLPQLTQAP